MIPSHCFQREWALFADQIHFRASSSMYQCSSSIERASPSSAQWAEPSIAQEQVLRRKEYPYRRMTRNLPADDRLLSERTERMTLGFPSMHLVYWVYERLFNIQMDFLWEKRLYSDSHLTKQIQLRNGSVTMRTIGALTENRKMAGSSISQIELDV